MAKKTGKSDTKKKKVTKRKTASKKKTATKKTAVKTSLTPAKERSLFNKREKERKKLETIIKKANRVKPKIIRDPIHDIITIDNNLVLDLINSKAMQRLRRIRQLGNTSLVFPGAEHSRFAHSLGVYHLSGVMVDHLNLNNKKNTINKYDKFIVQLAALLHDIGHGPFSHLFEQALVNIKYCTKDERDHEEWTKKIINKDKEIDGIFNKHLGPNYNRVKQDIIHIIGKSYDKPEVYTIVSSQFDVDRFDYMLRDSHMTGVNYGNIDLNWLFHNLMIKELIIENNQDKHNIIVFNIRRGLSSLHEYILGNFHLYKNVYLHKTIQASDAMIISILIRALDLLKTSKGKKKKTILGFDNKALLKISNNKKLSIPEYLSLDDNVVFSWIAKWASNSKTDTILKKLTKDFLNRKLFKIVDLDSIIQDNDQKRREFLNKVSVAIGKDHRYYSIELEPSRPAYKPINAIQIYYITDEKDNEPKKLSEISNHPYADPISSIITSRLIYKKHFLAIPNEKKYDEIVEKIKKEILK